MFFSGLLLWEPLTPTWSLARWNLFLTSPSRSPCFPAVWRLLALPSQPAAQEPQAFLRTTGRIIEALLLVCLASGLVLVLHGTPGDSLGNLASWAHWLSALALTPLVLRHAWRWTILEMAHLILC
jgi:hypothetical protein